MFLSARKVLEKSLGRCDRFRAKFDKIGAILTIFRGFEDFHRLLEDLQGLEGRHETCEVPIRRSCVNF